MRLRLTIEVGTPIAGSPIANSDEDTKLDCIPDFTINHRLKVGEFEIKCFSVYENEILTPKVCLNEEQYNSFKDFYDSINLCRVEWNHQLKEALAIVANFFYSKDEYTCINDLIEFRGLYDNYYKNTTMNFDHTSLTVDYPCNLEKIGSPEIVDNYLKFYAHKLFVVYCATIPLYPKEFEFGKYDLICQFKE